MITAIGYAASSATSRLGPFRFTRRAPGDHDVRIEILYCGVCHTDLHQVRDHWGSAVYPMVPGHEIVGRVTGVGKAVRKLAVGNQRRSPSRVCRPIRHRRRSVSRTGLISPTWSSRRTDGRFHRR